MKFCIFGGRFFKDDVFFDVRRVFEDVTKDCVEVSYFGLQYKKLFW